MDNIDEQYRSLIMNTMDNGILGNGRNGPYRSIIGHSLVIPFNGQFQMIKSKHLNLPLIVSELKWFLTGSSEIPDDLKNIWQPFANEWSGNQIYSYGYALRTNGTDEDQWLNAINELVYATDSRRAVINLYQSWYNPPPCHMNICLSNRKGELYMSVMQRSADIMLGLPWDITQYSILLFLIAKALDLRPKQLNWFIHDAHIYENHRNITGYFLENVCGRFIESKQELVFNNYPQGFNDLVNIPWMFDVEFPNYNPYMKLKVPYNV